MSTEFRPYAPNIALGIAIVSVGVALLLDRLGLVDGRLLLQYWPVLVVLFGASIVWQAVFGPEEGGRRGQPLLVSPGLIVLLVIVGIVATRADFRRFSRQQSAADTVSVSAIMAGNRHVSGATAFRGADMTSVMGGSALDLRKATIAEGGEAVVDVFALMGGVDLFVPRHWLVAVDVVPIMGAVEDRRARWPSPADEDENGRRRRSRRAEAAEAEPDAATAPAVEASPDRAASTQTAPGAATTPAQGAAAEAVQPAPTPEQVANPPRLIIRGFVMMAGVNIRS